MSGTGVALNPQPMRLNAQQDRAAAAIDGPVMVLAGAGSGKTRVITARLARMLSAGIDPRAIVALTFTNKAAAEMRERAGISRRGRRTAPTVCTFHALGLQLVRRFSDELGFRSARHRRRRRRRAGHRVRPAGQRPASARGGARPAP